MKINIILFLIINKLIIKINMEKKLKNSVDIKLSKITNLNYNNYFNNYINNILNNNLI